MLSLKWLLAAIAAAFLHLGSANAADVKANAAVATYKAHASFSLATCGFAVIEARSRAETAGLNAAPDRASSASPQDCIRTGEDGAKPLLRAASASFKEPSKKAALAGYHAAFVSALRGMLPAAGEMVYQYNARQAALKDKLAAADAMLTAEGVE